MMSLSTIKKMSDEAAVKAARLNRKPYVPFDTDEIENYPPYPFPNIGSHNPPGWEEVEDEDGHPLRLFVDISGVDPHGPAMGEDRLKNKLVELEEVGEGKYGYAIVEVGQFQCYIGVFKKNGESEGEEVDEISVEAEMRHEEELENIEECLNSHVSYDACIAEDGEEPWPAKLHNWFYDRQDKYPGTCETILSKGWLKLKEALPALIDMGMADEDLLLRDVNVNGHRLQLWETHERMQPNHHYVYFRFMLPSGKQLFAEFLGVPGHTCVDSDEVLRTALSFITLRPGDTDKEYFKDYTEEQMDWAETEAEELSMWAADPEEDEDDIWAEDSDEEKESMFKDWEEEDVKDG